MTEVFLQDFKLEEDVQLYSDVLGKYQGKSDLPASVWGEINAAAGTALVVDMQPDALFMVGASGALSRMWFPAMLWLVRND